MWDEYRDVVNKFIINNEERNDLIVEKAFEMVKEGLVLILVDLIKHGEELAKKVASKMSGHTLIFVHGNSKKRKEIFNAIKKDEYNIVISTKIYGEGVDIPNMRTLILANGGKSVVKTVQEIGRPLTIFPDKQRAVIYDFMDRAKSLKGHFNDRYEIYKELLILKDMADITPSSLYSDINA